MNKWRQRFTSRKLSSKSAAIAVLADGIYAVKGQSRHDPDFSWVFKAVPTPTAMDDALKDAVKELGLADYTIQLILGQGQYQSLSIDKPDIPEAEWSTALPFLVKDLVNESPSKIVAAGVLSSIGNKLQTYITHRERVKSLIALCDKVGVSLAGISVEEAMLGYAMSPDSSEMLLYRQGKGGVMLAAYVDQAHCLQRQVRGIQSPITGEDANPLVLDSLALELQRSLDYLSPQLRGKAVSTVKVYCDGEDSLTLANELSGRLNVSVISLLNEKETILPIGVLIALGAMDNPDSAPNLYPEDMRPKKEWLTLTNVVASWLLGGLLIGGGWGYFYWQEMKTSELLVIENRTLSGLNSQHATLEAQLAARQPSEETLQRVRVLEKSIADNRASMRAIDAHDDSLTVGYAGVMKDLAAIHRQDVSLRRIAIRGPMMDIKGYAAAPESVPAWVQQFKSRPHLIERGFRHLAIERDVNQDLQFTLQTNTVNRPK